MIAGALPSNPDELSPGSGPVSIHDNVIQSNLANDDGGGLRFLMAGNFPMDVYNNMIANNVSTHEGGGVGLNDATERALLQQHGDEERHDGDRAHVERSAGTGRPVDLAEQRRPCRPRCPADRRPSATRCCSTTSSGTTVPEPGPWRR